MFTPPPKTPVLWLMIPSSVVDVELDAWLAILPKGSVIIDGGNSDYRLTEMRAERVANAGMTLLDVGTSGGVWGYENGFSMMVGGDKDTYEKVTSVLDTDRKSTRLNSSHTDISRMPSSA